jgi:hypothetical protein
MPIIRTYACPECSHFLEVWVNPEQWDQPPPECPQCAARLQQEFKPPALVGMTPASKAAALAYKIAEEDYGVADIKPDGGRVGSTPKVSYKDIVNPQIMKVTERSTWGANQEVVEGAISIGRRTRSEMGGKDGLDRLQEGIKAGTIPDLIEVSKRRSMKVW